MIYKHSLKNTQWLRQKIKKAHFINGRKEDNNMGLVSEEEYQFKLTLKFLVKNY